jgi:hypothetical protein
MTTTRIDPFSVEARAAALADQIGFIRSQIAPQLGTLKTLEKALKDLGPGRYKGNHFEANVFTGERSTLDMEAVRNKLSPQFIAAHTTTSVTTTLKVTARQLNDTSLAS